MECDNCKASMIFNFDESIWVCYLCGNIYKLIEVLPEKME